MGNKTRELRLDNEQVTFSATLGVATKRVGNSGENDCCLKHFLFMIGFFPSDRILNKHESDGRKLNRRATA